MKIEKVNDTQIRCTLTREDLESREINLSELAYGSEKAKDLFRDMMQQANYEFGFEAENIPLMIEAIPLSSESIILIITKVEYPEELDTRFSQFTEASEQALDDDYDNQPEEAHPMLEGAEDILKLLNKIHKAALNNEEKNTEASPANKNISDKAKELIKQVEDKKDITKLYILDDIDDVIRVANIITPLYHGSNEIYHDDQDSKYYLFLHKTDHSSEEFNRICNILSEYASQGNFTKATEAYYLEHCDKVIKSPALQTIASL